MSQKLRTAAVLTALALPFAAHLEAQTPRTRPVTQAEVDRITRDAILIDTHDDVTSKTVTGYDIAKPNKGGQTDLPRMKGFLGAEFFAVYVGAEYVKDNHSANRTLEMIDTVRTDIIHNHPNDFVFATTADDIIKAHKEHKIAALMGIEGGHAIEDSLRLLRDYYALGIRYMTLTHFNTNNWADSQGDVDNKDVPKHNGLTPFGKDVVREMNRLGMMVDISHVADKTFYDALETSSAPIIASHSSCRAISSHTRNMTDDMIKALAAKGGVIQISFGCDFLSERYYEAAKPLMAELRPKFMEAMKIADPTERDAAIEKLEADAAAKVPPATLADVVAHIDHAVKVGGIDHVGIGTDFDGVGCVPSDLDSYDKFPALTRALLEKGYSAEDIKKIYGGNLLRVMHAVEQQAVALKNTPPIETVYKK
ncbi:dipeptidase [Granulicella sibirica]|uniref:Membrane dipeptidase n=1 Tax=Granulicella sibirica TaxID=2479048 RepID=A0A4Q0TAH3_9BACT|nr:dipeptidase [Granulicella sibirica]RXH58776.1 Membrane dipeptidase [Granulicella sibirica]